MTDFTATHFRFEVEALTTLAFDPYTGSALRGGLVTALQRNFCAVNLFPYLVLAVSRVGADGVGRKLDHGERGTWHRGRFVLRAIEEVNPLTGVRRTLMGEGQQMVQTPQHAVSTGVDA